MSGQSREFQIGNFGFESFVQLHNCTEALPLCECSHVSGETGVRVVEAHRVQVGGQTVHCDAVLHAAGTGLDAIGRHRDV